ncbi:hypothetical protein [Rhizobacter sp. Root1221]|uniref:hypothetical protein n=1 Tax=Rhizobacter sp. Root1221 TaxID=1736433 RepID=UPI0006F45160|nr:hypothetical protein [Rhizobacter sp. Root1221]KQW02809.1 hypothetical protein ASC87_00165 [Rhizobacter sp. Root1221]
MDTQQLFEEELQRRGIDFSIDPESGRHSLDIGGTRILINLTILDRDLAKSGDVGCVARFVDTVIESRSGAIADLSAEQLYWAMEPNNYEEPADFRVPLSDRVDRVLVHQSSDGCAISWVSHDMLQRLGLSEAEAGGKAFTNLARTVQEATVEWEDIDGVRLGYLVTSLPFKASLLLAPNLREVVESVTGWPVLAVAPDRDFLYFWAAEHADFVGRLGGVVVREYQEAAYPISTEVFEISESLFRAIGEFPIPA